MFCDKHDLQEEESLQEQNKDLLEYNDSLKQQNKELNDKLSLVSLTYDVDDVLFMHKRHKPMLVIYPSNKPVVNYLEYRPLETISSLATTIRGNTLNSTSSVDLFPIALMKYMDKNLECNFLKIPTTKKKWTYLADKGEYWQTPEETIQKGKGDCEDFAILQYFILREMFMQVGKWDEVRHRLFMQDIHLFNGGTILNYDQRHANLIWLHSDGKFRTIETTYFLSRAINNYSSLAQCDNDTYGPINYIFNEKDCFVVRGI